MTRKIIVDAHFEDEIRVAEINENNQIENLFVDSVKHRSTKGNIYVGEVLHVEPSLQAAFINIGLTKSGFLGESHLFLDEDIEGLEYQNSIENLKPKQKILVQVLKDERGKKGAALTTLITLSGVYCILIPNSQVAHIGISRKIKGQIERKRLKEIIENLGLQEPMSLVLRTVAEGQTLRTIEKDLKNLLKIWEKILRTAEKIKGPKLIYEDEKGINKKIREMYSDEVDEVLIQGNSTYQQIRGSLKSVIPLKQIKEYKKNDLTISTAYHLDSQIDDLLNVTVVLPSGGKIIINKTEALTAIDVNSSSSIHEENLLKTSFNTNFEAAYEASRQIRLRNISGLIVIDFIDLDDFALFDDIVKVIKTAFKYDRARVSIGKVSEFGVLTMTRQYMGLSLEEKFTEKCLCCNGIGRTKTKETVAFMVLRAIEKKCSLKKYAQINVHLDADLEKYVTTKKGYLLKSIEKQFNTEIYFFVEKSFNYNKFDVEGIPLSVPNRRK